MEHLNAWIFNQSNIRPVPCYASLLPRHNQNNLIEAVFLLNKVEIMWCLLFMLEARWNFTNVTSMSKYSHI